MRSAALAIAAVLTCLALPAIGNDAAPADASQPSPPADQAAPPKTQDAAPLPVQQNAAPAAPAPEIVAPAKSAAEQPPNPAGRFSFTRVDGGFLRLDGRTGQIAFCSAHIVGWACQAVPEDRAALEKEIARLQDEVERLKKEIAELREPPPPRPPAELTPPSDKSDDAARLRADLERARVAFENAWRRLVEMIVNLQKDMKPKG